MTDFKSLRSIAEAATLSPGPKFLGECGPLVDFYQTFNPALVKLMLDALEEAEDLPWDTSDMKWPWVRALTGKLAAIREHLEAKP